MSLTPPRRRHWVDWRCPWGIWDKWTYSRVSTILCHPSWPTSTTSITNNTYNSCTFTQWHHALTPCTDHAMTPCNNTTQAYHAATTPCNDTYKKMHLTITSYNAWVVGIGTSGAGLYVHSSVNESVWKHPVANMKMKLLESACTIKDQKNWVCSEFVWGGEGEASKSWDEGMKEARREPKEERRSGVPSQHSLTLFGIGRRVHSAAARAEDCHPEVARGGVGATGAARAGSIPRPPRRAHPHQHRLVHPQLLRVRGSPRPPLPLWYDSFDSSDSSLTPLSLCFILTFIQFRAYQSIHTNERLYMNSQNGTNRIFYFFKFFLKIFIDEFVLILLTVILPTQDQAWCENSQVDPKCARHRPIKWYEKHRTHPPYNLNPHLTSLIDGV